MRRSVLMRAILAAVVTTASAAYANAHQFQATLSGFNEVGSVGAVQTGAIFSNGQGTLTVNLDTQQQSLTYTLTYSNMSSQVSVAHIHFGKIHVGGGVIAFLCSNIGTLNTPACPLSGSVSGMLTPTSVIGPTPQGIFPGDFNKLAAALLSNTAYGNVHTANFPAGEIRGELRQPGQNQNQNQ